MQKIERSQGPKGLATRYPLRSTNCSGFTQHQSLAKNSSDIQTAATLSEPRFGAGFTLIETLVAVTILTLSVTGPLYAASRAIVAAEIAQDKLIASYLAQEGVEYVRAMRDDEYLAAYQAGGADVSTAAWDAFLYGSDRASITPCRTVTCTLDPARAMGSGSGFSLLPCSGAACTPLYLANGFYTQNGNLGGAEQTPFTRTVQVTDVSARTARVVSTVSWSFHGTPHVVTIVDYLTPWQ